MGFLNLVRMNYRSSIELLPHGYVCFLHFDIVVVDFGSNPITRLNIVTKMAPPPTLPNSAPKNPIILPTTFASQISFPVKSNLQR